MTIEQLKMIAASKFVTYTMERLDKRYDILSTIIADGNALDDEIMDAARQRKEVRLCIELFLEEDVDDPRATPGLILNAMGYNVNKLAKRTIGGEIAEDILDKTVGATKATTQATKKGLNSFANWLVSKTE